MLYYQVGDKKFGNNVDALREFTTNSANGLELKFDFKFTNNPQLWLTEPPLSVHDYFDRHAQVINYKYNKINIRYSGGTDSNTVLNSFLREGVPVHVQHTVTDEMSKFSQQLYSAVKKDFAQIAKNPLIKEFDVRDHRGLSQREFERGLLNFRGHLSSQMSNTSFYWDLSSDHTTIYDINERDVLISGKEKPRLKIENGWWHWEALDAKYGESHFDLDRGKHIWFFLTDDVPELQIKMTWNKIKFLESLARKQKIKIDFDWLELMQGTNSPYYEQVNESMGLQAVNQILHSNTSKLCHPSGVRREQYKNWNDNSGITNLMEDYTQDIIKNLRSDLYRITRVDDHARNFAGHEITNIAGVFHKPIPVCPVSPDLLTIV